eukprot:UN03197
MTALQLKWGGPIEKINLTKFAVPEEEQQQVVGTKFDPAVVAKDSAVVVSLSAVWCGPCAQIAPAFYKMAEANTNVKFIQFFKCAKDKVTKKIQEIQTAGKIEDFGKHIAVSVTTEEYLEPYYDELDVKGIPFVALFAKGGDLIFSGHPAEPAFVQELAKINAQ